MALDTGSLGRVNQRMRHLGRNHAGARALSSGLIPRRSPFGWVSSAILASILLLVSCSKQPSTLNTTDKTSVPEMTVSDAKTTETVVSEGFPLVYQYVDRTHPSMASRWTIGTVLPTLYWRERTPISAKESNRLLTDYYSRSPVQGSDNWQLLRIPPGLSLYGSEVARNGKASSWPEEAQIIRHYILFFPVRTTLRTNSLTASAH